MAGLLRVIKWDDMLVDKYDLSGNATGWGLNLARTISTPAKSDVIRAAFVVGEGIQNS